MTHLEKIRAEIIENYDKGTFSKGIHETFHSPTRKFRLDTTNYFQKDSNWDLTKVEIYNELSQEKIFDFFSNDGQFFFGWLEFQDIEYIVCAEDIFGGQTVVDLTNEKMASFSTGEDGFIWTDFHLSPDGRKLASMGCYWGCPYIVRLFDFTKPLSLPLPKLGDFELLSNNETISSWADNDNLNMTRTENNFIQFASRDKIYVKRLLKINGG